MSNISEEMKIEIIAKAIQTDAGWTALAKSIQTEEAKTQCVDILRKIGNYSNNKDINIYGNLNINLSNLLVETLETYMEKVK